MFIRTLFITTFLFLLCMTTSTVSAQSVDELKALIANLQQQLYVLQTSGQSGLLPVQQPNTSNSIYDGYRDYYGDSFDSIYGVSESEAPTFIGPVATVPTVNTSSSSSCAIFIQNLSIGSNDATTGGQVTKLQTLLRAGGFYVYPEVTGYYGSVTQSAVERYQAARGIVSSGTPDSNGFGAVGPQTRTRLNQEHCSRITSGQQIQTNRLVESETTLSEDDFEIELIADREEYKPGDTMFFTAYLENHSNQTLEYDCDDFTIEATKLRIKIEGDDFCFGTSYVDPGQRVTFTRSHQLATNISRDGRFQFNATFPGGFVAKENVYIERGEITFDLSLGGDAFRPGDIIEIGGIITNDTVQDLVYPQDLCPVLRVEIDGVPEEITGNTESCYSYLDEYSYFNSYFQDDNVARAGQVTTLRHNYQIPADFNNEGNYTVKVTFPGGTTKTEQIYIGANDPGINVSISIDKDAYDRGEIIQITGTLENKSEGEISISGRQTGPSCGYLFVTVDGVVDSRPVNCSTSTFLIDRLDTNESGTFESTFQIPSDSATGNTTLHVTFPGGNSASKNITIQ